MSQDLSRPWEAGLGLHGRELTYNFPKGMDQRESSYLCTSSEGLGA